MVGDDRDAVSDVEDLANAGALLRDGAVERRDLSADHRARRERRVEHAGLLRVDAVHRAAARLVGAVEALQAASDDLEFALGLELHVLGNGLLRRGGRELAVGHLALSVRDMAVFRAHLRGRNLPLLRRGAHQHHAGARACLAQRLPRIAHAGAAAGELAAQKPVDVHGVHARLLDAHVARIDAELLGEQHRERGVHILPHLVAVAREHHAAIGEEPDPCVGRDCVRRRARGLGGLAEAKRDHHSAACDGGNLQEIAARDGSDGVHAEPSSCLAASLMAARMRP